MENSSRIATRVLFVCLGNICRSPAAEGAFRDLIDKSGLSDEFVVDSAGTGAWHVGEPADERMREAARERGIRLSSIARQVTPSDFEDFDWILAMDRSNLEDLRRLAHSTHHARIRLFRDFDAEAPGADVPDPYFGATDGFAQVVDIVTRTSSALLEHLRRTGHPLDREEPS